MAKKCYVGIDIGHDQLKLAWIKNGILKKSVSVQMPENLFKDDRVVSDETMSELIKTTMKENGIREKNAAFLLSSGNSYVRNITMPVMTASQLQYNLPYEFRDYFTEEMHEYIFDYAMYPEEKSADSKTKEGESEEERVMNLLGVAVHKDAISEIKELLGKSGLKTEIIAPALSAYMNIIEGAEKKGADTEEEYCFIDMGYKTIRMNIFKGRRYRASRELESGIENVDETVAGIFNVDKHLAHTYLMTNFQNCQSHEDCIEKYNSIGIELLRALNFYQFSNPDSHLKNIYVCGGGAYISSMLEVIASIIDEYEIHMATDLIKGTAGAEQELLAIGVAMQ